MKFFQTALIVAILCVGMALGGLRLGKPMSYYIGQQLPVRVDSLTSVSKVMPMDWYSMPWCAPSLSQRKQFRTSQNLGEVLFGHQVEISLFNIEMMTNSTCSSLCDAMEMGEKENKLLMKRIEDNYRGNLILDGLPVAEDGSQNKRRLSKSVSVGYPLGIPQKSTGTGSALLFNHLAFRIEYHHDAADLLDDSETFRIVGFYVTPMSVDHSKAKCDNSFSVESAPMLSLPVSQVRWTYSVSWEESDVEWSTRWDVYMKTSAAESRIHWFSILNSLLIVLLLSAVIGFILIRALRRDLARYNDPEAIQEEREETGWKLVHGDVFRKPEAAGLLAVYVGSGAQLFGMCFVTLGIASLGFLSPANRGSLIIALLFLYVFLGFTSGYITARMAKYFKMRSWKIIFASGLFFPGQMFLVYFLLNFVHWGNKASSATPIGAMLTIAALWVLVSVPLVVLGGAIGYRAEEFVVPCKVNTIPRSIPPQPWYLEFPAAAIIPGALPFGAAFIESVFLLSSVWQGRIYYVFGFLTLVFVIVLICCAEATIVLVYFQLVNLDYRWWWKSFIGAGSYGMWLFAYSIFYYLTSLTIRSWWSSVLYYGYMFMISYFCFVLTGAIGFLASFAFVKAIYGSIRVD